MMDLRPDRILQNIIADNKKDYVYIVMGRSGATGKTSICNDLKRCGFMAFEISENIFDLVTYNDFENHVVIDDLNKQVIIVLNRKFGELK
jgi:predicted ATPase